MMKNIVLFLTIAALALSCSKDEDPTSTCSRYLKEYTASNAEPTKYVVENGRLVQTAYGNTISPTVYHYDGSGKLTKTETTSANGTLVYEYSYNNDDRMILTKVHSDDVLVAQAEITYADGFPTRYIFKSGMDLSVQSISESEYEYEDGNPVKQTIYIYRSDAAKPDPMEIITIRYDSYKNPFNTLNQPASAFMSNNPIEYIYQNQQENNNVISYTYNNDGYPVTYETTHVNRPDYPVVTGTYAYNDCQ
jgi:hypothetical protein